ncbi:paraquat-inducible membrane protein A [Methylophaga sp. 41_12_T18]|nr:paraquat-inducible membrane protein A [Methylophaga sp. 41_12_T18]
MPVIAPLYLRWLLLITTCLLLTGFITPMLTITKLVFFDHSFSILSGITQLWRDQHYFLFVVIAAFSVLLPLAKVVVLFNLLSPKAHQPEHRQKLLHLMHDYGRWAMLDVMVVALLIMSVKLGAIASIQVHLGLYIFAAAVILIMLITQQVVRHLD